MVKKKNVFSSVQTFKDGDICFVNIIIQIRNSTIIFNFCIRRTSTCTIRVRITLCNLSFLWSRGFYVILNFCFVVLFKIDIKGHVLSWHLVTILHFSDKMLKWRQWQQQFLVLLIISHCANQYKSGWWQSDCHCANPNGLYLWRTNTATAQWITYESWRSQDYSLKYVHLMVRRTD